ncbi:MAG TPA: hypothetical protein VIJ00_06060, partial [Nakamurella sp.]
RVLDAGAAGLSTPGVPVARASLPARRDPAPFAGPGAARVGLAVRRRPAARGVFVHPHRRGGIPTHPASHQRAGTPGRAGRTVLSVARGKVPA